MNSSAERLLLRGTNGWSGSRLCENATPIRFRGSSHPSRAANNRIQRDLRGRFSTALLLEEFSHSLGRSRPLQEKFEVLGTKPGDSVLNAHHRGVLLLWDTRLAQAGENVFLSLLLEYRMARPRLHLSPEAFDR